MQAFHFALLMAAAISLVTGAAEAHSSGGGAHSVGAAGVRSTLRSSVPGSGAPGMSLTMPRAQAPQSSAAPDLRASGPSSSSSGGGTLSAGPPQPPPSGSASPAPPSQVGHPPPQVPGVGSSLAPTIDPVRDRRDADEQQPGTVAGFTERVCPQYSRRRRQIAAGLYEFLGTGHAHEQDRVASRMQSHTAGLSERALTAA